MKTKTILIDVAERELINPEDGFLFYGEGLYNFNPLKEDYSDGGLFGGQEDWYCVHWKTLIEIFIQHKPKTIDVIQKAIDELREENNEIKIWCDECQRKTCSTDTWNGIVCSDCHQRKNWYDF